MSALTERILTKRILTERLLTERSAIDHGNGDNALNRDAP